MKLPTSLPEHDPSALWSLQQQLLIVAEYLVGRRDQSKTIYQPAFHENGPHIRNTPTLDGAFVELGAGSKVYWPTVVFEMAHETIHLLNPVEGYTNWLEEGVAVEFSIHAQQLFGVPIQSPTAGPYFEALEMVRSLPGGTFSAAYRVREIAGSLGTVTVEQLCSLFPSYDRAGLLRLAEKCVPR
jgi:hypothetical protein